MGKGSLILKVMLRSLWGFLIFLIILGALNLINMFVKQLIFNEMVIFLNQSIIWIVLFALLFLFGEIFKIMDFPYNLPWPLLDAVGSLFLITFIFNVIFFVNRFVLIPQVINFNMLYILIASLTFILVVLVGYIKLLMDSSYSKKRKVIRYPSRK